MKRSLNLLEASQRTFKKLQPKTEYRFKILLLGDAAVGKTSLMVRYVDNTFDQEYISTLGVDFMVKWIFTEKMRIKLGIWDVAGQSKFKTFRHKYFKGTNFIIFIFDITNANSFVNLKKRMDDFVEINQDERVKFAVIGNKSDLEKDRVVETKEFSELFPDYAKRVSFCTETSAKTGDNVNDAFQKIVNVLLKEYPEESSERLNVQDEGMERAS